ncbi:MAG: glutamate--tRNA ligase [Chloroflexota bacterium]
MTNNDSVRVRFAPSPTGPMHIGGLRTAIFNWLFARHHGGKFILRVEDTDRSRYQENAEDLIYNALDWVGLDIDEGPRIGGEHGPYRQSERIELYQTWAKWLVENDKAYYDYTTPEELQQINEEKRKLKQPPGYDRRHRNISDAERAALKAEGRPEVIRFKMPLTGKTEINDRLRGKIVTENDQLNDLVLLKADGFPTYHLANVIDDHFMGITHVMRANEWIPTAPIHKHLYEAFGWEMPELIHLPLLLAAGAKMSKRNPPKDKHGNPLPVLVTDYQQLGYLPSAMMNFLTNIGWTFGDDKEVFSVEEAIAAFDVDRISSSNSNFPSDKLTWFNGIYIREKLPENTLKSLLREAFEGAGYMVDDDKLNIIAPAIQTRIETLNDAVDLAGFIFADTFTPPKVEELIQKKMDLPKTKHVLELAHGALEGMNFADPASMEQPFRDLAKDNGYKFGQLAGTLRTATAAQRIAPPLFDTFAALGKEETLARIKTCIGIVDQALEAEGTPE